MTTISSEGAMRDLLFIKLGGSLLTDKRRPETARAEVIARLGREVAEVAAGQPGGVIVGHGSGSFGHASADRHDLRGVLRLDSQIDGLAETRSQAVRLDQMVVEALLAGGARPFSYAPSSYMMSAAGRPRAVRPEPILHGLDLGLLPVVYGDVVMDREWGAAICSTETVFLALLRALGRRGRRVGRVLWLGETEGVYGADGRLVPQLTAAAAHRLLPAIGGAAGADVTGGMHHRLQTAIALARLGITSWIGDGREPELLQRAAAGEQAPGTLVVPEQ